MTRAFLLLASWLALVTGAFAAEPDYVRYREDAQGARLEVAVRSFTLPSGQAVDLIGVVHIADAAYYDALNARFDAYDAVLFELVGDPELLTRREVEPAGSTGANRADAPRADSTLSTIQLAAAKNLALTFQLEAIDYTKKNMVHADASADEFARMQAERGETTMSLFGRAMRAQMVADLSGKSRARNEFDTFGLIRILMSRDSALEFKKALAKTLDQTESMTALMEGEDGSAVLTGRNRVAVDKLKEVLADRRKRRVAVFYGGAHMPGIETALLQDFGAKPAGEEWLPAWSMPASPRPAKNLQDTARG